MQLPPQKWTKNLCFIHVWNFSLWDWIRLSFFLRPTFFWQHFIPNLLTQDIRREAGWRGGGVGDLPLPPIQHTSAREVLFGVSEWHLSSYRSLYSFFFGIPSPNFFLFSVMASKNFIMKEKNNFLKIYEDICYKNANGWKLKFNSETPANTSWKLPDLELRISTRES